MVRDPKNAARMARYVQKIAHARGDADRAGNRLRREVTTGRENGLTWSEIGAAVGLTAQGAQQKYGTRGERSDVIEARQASRAARYAGSVDPWPDGTTQGTIDPGDTGPT